MSSFKSITVKRINGDFKLFQSTNPKHFDIYPNPNNILEIWFIMYGLKGSSYESGQYIGKIIHSPDYPMKAPDFYIYTPNGRFHLNKKICLTNSSYHQESWAPAAWNLVSILEGLFSIWHSDNRDDLNGVGHLHTNNSDISLLASNSINYNKNNLNDIYNNFPKIKNNYNPYE
jgi:ubiquitin-conjugating enzyme E2 J2